MTYAKTDAGRRLVPDPRPAYSIPDFVDMEPKELWDYIASLPPLSEDPAVELVKEGIVFKDNESFEALEPKDKVKPKLSEYIDFIGTGEPWESSAPHSIPTWAAKMKDWDPDPLA